MTDRVVTRRIRDPFMGKDVALGDDILDRLRGRYACGPLMADGEPEMGWRQMAQVPIQLDAADRIERLEGAFAAIAALLGKARMPTVDEPLDGKAGFDVTLRLADEKDALELQRMLVAVLAGKAATIGPEPRPRGPILGWDTDGSDG